MACLKKTFSDLNSELVISTNNSETSDTFIVDLVSEPSSIFKY